MDYSKIRLKNERSTHVVKRLNRLNTWKFFKVLYRDNMWRLFGFSILMLVCFAPIFAMQMVSSMQISGLEQTLPILNGFGYSTGVWFDVGAYYDQLLVHHNVIYGLYTVATSLISFVVFCGGFAVIRDAFWTGKLSSVGVFKSLGKGIKAGWAYALVSTVIVSFGVFGIYNFYVWCAAALPGLLWLTIILTVLISLVLLLVVMYLMVLCSVAVTYEQSVYENMDDAWRILWLNFLPNLINIVIALLPIPLYFVFGQGMLQTIYLVFMLMFGGMFFPLVWQTHMMKIFALFHPVESKKKKDVKREEQERMEAEAQRREEAAAERRESRKKHKKSEPVVDSTLFEKSEEPENEELDSSVWDEAYPEASEE